MLLVSATISSVGVGKKQIVFMVCLFPHMIYADISTVILCVYSFSFCGAILKKCLSCLCSAEVGFLSKFCSLDTIGRSPAF